MKYLKIIVLTLMVSATLTSYAQRTAVFTDANLAYKKGVELYEKGVFGSAQQLFKQVLEGNLPANHAESDLLKQKAELQYAQSAIRLEQSDGEKLVLDFIRKYAPSAVSNQARLEMANYYFAQRKYDKAINYYEKVPTLDFSNDEITELKFKLGYSYLIKKKYKKAKNLFKQVKDIRGTYYDPANYYYGITEFQSKNYKSALAAFERVKKSKKYSREVPFYILQIAFAEKDYDRVIRYGSTVASDSQQKKYREINKLVGQAHFERKDFRKALPYLETSAEGGRLRQQDVYQLGYTQYKVGRYKDAIDKFEQLNSVKSKMGQNALYSLGDCHIKAGSKLSARNAFKKAAAMNFDKKIQAESEFLYAKLSYELKFDNDAIAALQNIPRSSPYYVESQELLSQVFLNTRNYSKALKIIESLPNKSVKMREAYQQVAYYRGVQVYNDGDGKQAKALFVKSLQNPIDQRIRALANYWMGEINYVLGDYNSSIKDYNQFITIAKSIPRAFTDEASEHTANYALGYIHLKKKDYVTATRHFTNTVNGLKPKLNRISNTFVKTNLYPDAMLRAGDCNFKRNRYTQAMSYYNTVINNRYNDKDYALYQKGLILGLQKKPVEKIVTMENLAYKNAKSEYADDALLALGATYLGLGKYDEANKHLLHLIRNYKNKSNLVNPALLKLGLIAYNQDQTDKALNYYKQVFSNNPVSREAQDALRGIEEIYIDRGEPEKYFAFLESVPGYKVSNSTKDSISYASADVQFKNGDYEKAIRAFTSYLRSFPNGANAIASHYQRGESYYVLERYNESLPDYENVVSRGQSRYYARSVRKAALVSYNGQKDFGKAYNLYKKLAEISAGQDLYEAQLGVLRSAYRLGGKNGEIQQIATTLTADTNAPKAERGEAHYYLGKTALASNDLEKARRSFNQVIRLTDNVYAAEARYQVTYIYYLKRDLETAQQLALNANQEIPEDYSYWLAKSIVLLGDIFSEKGDIFNAKASLQSIIENYEGDAELINEAKAKLAKLEALESRNSLIAPESDSDDLEMDEGNQ